MRNPNHFIQHIPKYCQGFTPENFSFDTTTELLDIILNSSKDISKDIMKHSPFPMSKFNRFSLSDSALIAEYDHGFQWFVIGYLGHTKGVELPKWFPFYRTEETRKDIEGETVRAIELFRDKLDFYALRFKAGMQEKSLEQFHKDIKKISDILDLVIKNGLVDYWEKSKGET